MWPPPDPGSAGRAWESDRTRGPRTQPGQHRGECLAGHLPPGWGSEERGACGLAEHALVPGRHRRPSPLRPEAAPPTQGPGPAGPGRQGQAGVGRLLVAIGERRRPRRTGKPGIRTPGRREGLKQQPAQLGQEIQTWATQGGELGVAEGRSQCLWLSPGTLPAL